MGTPKAISPYGLIQEELRGDPWKLLVACICLNLTSIKQVRPVIGHVFATYPDAATAARADEHELAGIIRPLGLYNRRARSIIRMSQDFVSGWCDITDLHGVGKYAADSYRIFIEGSVDVIPTDAKLKKYLDWARTQQ